jgi:hypothetical protein
MRELQSGDVFTSNEKLEDLGLNFNNKRSVFVDLDGGTAELQIETPLGFKRVTLYEENSLDTFNTPLGADFRMMLTGNATAFLV